MKEDFKALRDALQELPETIEEETADFETIVYHWTSPDINATWEKIKLRSGHSNDAIEELTSHIETAEHNISTLELADIFSAAIGDIKRIIRRFHRAINWLEINSEVDPDDWPPDMPEADAPEPEEESGEPVADGVIRILWKGSGHITYPAKDGTPFNALESLIALIDILNASGCIVIENPPRRMKRPSAILQKPLQFVLNTDQEGISRDAISKASCDGSRYAAERKQAILSLLQTFDVNVPES